MITSKEAESQANVAPPQGPAPPAYPTPSYDGQQPYQPQQQQQQAYPPQNGMQSPPLVHQPPPMTSPPVQRTAAEVGRDYQAELFARCAQGLHEPTTKYGMCGIITAVICFPIGLICLFTDTEQKCARCGTTL
ncbi:hypothetical protein HGRIS_012813 [Hohenbuehelia grisea]|uniref:Brain protein I3 n=1 Tax=Hohenbuehelia grisea TaxID=104357 RepID=A0ABR3ITR2_9AGAR